MQDSQQHDTYCTHYVTKPALDLQLPLNFVDEAVRLFLQRIPVDGNRYPHDNIEYKYLTNPIAMVSKLLVDKNVIAPMVTRDLELRESVLSCIE